MSLSRRSATILGILGLMAGRSWAGDPLSTPLVPPPLPYCTPSSCGRTEQQLDAVLFERQYVVPEPELNLREVTTKVPTLSLQVEYREEKQCVTILVPKPRELERIVSSISWLPETTIDPCTGCPCTTYKAVPQCRVEKYVVYETVPETREVTIKVPVFQPVESSVTIRHLTADWSTKVVGYTKLDMVTIPHEIKVPGSCGPHP